VLGVKSFSLSGKKINSTALFDIMKTRRNFLKLMLAIPGGLVLGKVNTGNIISNAVISLMLMEFISKYFQM